MPFPVAPLSGPRRWAAEAILRLAGLSSLAGALAVARHLRHAITAHRQPAPSDFLACLAGVVLLWIGMALAIAGPGLFRRIPRPPRALLP